MSTNQSTASSQPLSALLSQVLVAFTVEFDNEFERRMGEAGYPGERLSLVVWSNLIRFVAGGGVSVRDLAAQALAPQKQVKFELGCLERWGLVVLEPDPTDHRPVSIAPHWRTGRDLRDGWGSGRGIRAEWIVRLTSKGEKASEIWAPLPAALQQRWQAGFGNDEIDRLRRSLQAVIGQLEVELPHALPGELLDALGPFPPRITCATESLPLPTLLSQVLLAFRIEFDPESSVPLALCANTLRVLGEEPIRVAEIPRLTGGSPEATDVGWRLKPFVVVEPDPSGRRGKVARLTPSGLKARQTYFRLTGEIEQRWGQRFGKDEIRRLHDSLQGLLNRHNADGPVLSAGLVPPAGVVRAGCQAPALGRRDVGSAARERMRDLVAQTEAFVRDPAGTLPHYPLWDMNRGFGP